MTNLPSGTVTFLFTDIEGSTTLAREHPDEWEVAQQRHHTILREACENQGGYVFKIIGDSFQVAFATADAGLKAAVAAQRALQAEVWDITLIRVRMGLHTGAAEVTGGEYHGYMTLAQAARVMSAAHGNQILISNASSALVAPHLPQSVGLRDMGEHRLKGLLDAERLWQVDIPELQQDFPPLQTLNAIPNNLPIQLTSFVGRERDIVDVQQLLVAKRLLTLTGPGGTGKTRLALQLAADVLPEFPNGIWLVELAQLADPIFVIHAVMAVFGLRDVPGRSSLTVTIDYLRDRSLLLLLDNCEHLIDACARLADDLLRACPHLKIVATSREALGVPGETIYRIPSLALPDAYPQTPEALLHSDAGHLFVERAQATQPHFMLTLSNTSAITAICARLDGIPLAIELAAARVRLLTPEQIAARLDNRFSLLVGGSRTALPRQQTLRALIDWSYDLLPDAEQRLLCVLSVFAGGWSLEAAEAVSDAAEVLGSLAALENKSFIVVDDSGAAARYHLLETIRQYARDKLVDSGNAAGTRDRHLAFYLDLTETAGPKLTGSEMLASLDQLEVEKDNLRTALDWALEHDPLAALRLAAVLGTFWARRASTAEGLRWVQMALSRAQAGFEFDAKSTHLYLLTKARVHMAEASLCLQLGDNTAARAAIEASIALARQIDAPDILRNALGLGATIAGFNGDLTAAQAWVEECLISARQAEDVYALGAYGSLEMFIAIQSDMPVTPEMKQESLRAAHRTGNPWVIAIMTENVGRMTAAQGRLAEALTYFEEAAVHSKVLRDQYLQITNQSEIAHVMRKLGRLDEAIDKYRTTLSLFRERGQLAAVAHQMECLGFIAMATGKPERAATLFGAAEALRASIGSHMLLPERHEYDQFMSQLRTQIDESALRSAWAKGINLSLDEAIEFARALESVS